MENALLNFDNLISTTTHWNQLGEFTGYDVQRISLAPIHAIIGITIAMIFISIAIWPKK